MKYYICEETYDENTVYVTCTEELEKNDLVVFMSLGQPYLAKVVKEMDELEAVTNESEWFESLAHASVREYYEKRKAELEKAKLVKLMKEKLEIHALEEKLKKNAEIDSEMSSLFSMYKSICESE